MTHYDQSTLDTWLTQISQTLSEQLAPLPQAPLTIIGIHRGGVPIAQAIRERLAPEANFGTLNIHFYRDDFSRIGLHPCVGASQLPSSLENHHVILVDDVLHSGRTVRAAMNELFDYGRPARILLAVLATRRHGRELPISADASGITLDLADNQYVNLHTDPLSLHIETREDMP